MELVRSNLHRESRDRRRGERARTAKCDRVAKEAGLSRAFLDQKLIEFEMRRASLNNQFANHLDSAEQADSSELHQRYQQCRRKDLDEVQVYRDVELIEQLRWMEGKGPRVRFLSKEEIASTRDSHRGQTRTREVPVRRARNTLAKKGVGRKHLFRRGLLVKRMTL